MSLEKLLTFKHLTSNSRDLGWFVAALLLASVFKKLFDKLRRNAEPVRDEITLVALRFEAF